MIEDDVYTFHIDAFSPATIPMMRLAEYLATLAALFGNGENVHFQCLRSGSTQVVTRVEREAAPKVRQRVSAAPGGEEIAAYKAFKKLNDMLREDNTSADLILGNAKILAFPGRRIPRPAKIGPFTQDVSMEGVLVRIGGKDKSAHASIEDSLGQIHSFEISRDLARDLAPSLFGKPVRLIGTGRWQRNEDGQWEVSSLRSTRFERLNSEPLAETVQRLREISASFNQQATSGDITALQRMRNDIGGVN